MPHHPASFQPETEQLRQHEFILRTLLVGSFVLCFGILFYVSLKVFVSNHASSLPVLYTSLGATLFFGTLYVAMRRGYTTVASVCFCLFYYLIAVVLISRWGILLPQAILLFALSIISSSLMIGTAAGFSFTTATIGALAAVSYGHHTGGLPVDLSWNNTLGTTGDIIAYAFTFFILMSTAWLSNREIFHSFLRAQAAEIALKKERDQLEVTVEERTRELTERQQAEVSHLYHFAYFGKVTSSLLHDIVSPVSTVSATLQRLETNTESSELVNRAITNMQRIERYVKEAQSQYDHTPRTVEFTVATEVDQAVTALEEKATAGQVTLKTSLVKGTLFGDPLKLQRVIINLVTNAIDACLQQATRNVTITLTKPSTHFILTVQDTGIGISPDLITQIFEPFFSTKQSSDRMGIGLAICKEIIEEDFNGSISVSSIVGTGTTFTLSFTDSKPHAA